MMEQKHKGAWNEHIAILWLMNQGFEVFRNVSQHGIIDIVAFRDGVVRLFDVKAHMPSLSRERQQLGIQVILVSEEGECRIVEPSPSERTCKKCNEEFQPRHPNQKFCNTKCKSRWKGNK